MALVTAHLQGLGIGSGDLAKLLAGGIQSPVAAAGATLATATPTSGDVVFIGSGTVSTAEGVRLRSAMEYPQKQLIINHTSGNMKIYPPAATGFVGTSAVGAAYTIGSGAIAEFTAIGANSYAITTQKSSL